ncbi:AAA family ATPase [Burkholderia pseudomallei]|uniref:AAA family ATPase n=1 Tax=Burkholderia pseudomallei TaxID=28450 RepID=UPI0027DFB7FC|nr:AAA family ATPase [Burkholderia pseudomallei]
MILDSIAIQDFRKLVDRLVIDGLEPGLNLICGPNEAGKSTIAEAVRTVFLERYKVSSLSHIVPLSRPDGQPTVEVNFAIDGVTHGLKKQFVRKQRCELRIGSQVFSEDQAEERLAELLGFSRAERGASRPELAGIPGLLWVRQGHTGDVRDPGSHAAAYIRDALAKLAGGEVSGGDDVLINAVRDELFKLLTEKARRPTGPLATVESELTQLRKERDDLEQQQRDFDEDINRLGRLQVEFNAVQKTRPWEELQAKAADALKRAEAFDQLERQHREIQQKLEFATIERNALLQQEKQAADLETAVANDRDALSAAEVAAAQANDAHQTAKSAVANAQATSDNASAALELANAAVTVAELQRQLEVYRGDITRIELALEKAAEASEAVRELTRQAALVEIDEKKFKRLQGVIEKIVPLQARKDAALTRIEYRLTGEISVDGTPVHGDGTILLDGQKTIGLPGLGELTIVPGVSDVSALIAELQTLEVERGKLLLELGVTSPVDASTRLARWKELVAEKGSHSRILELHAPNGLETLRNERELAQGRLVAAQERLNGLPDVTGALPVSDAKRDFESARIHLDAARAALMASSDEKARTAANANNVRERLAGNETRLKDPEFVARRAQCQSSLVEKSAHIQEFSRTLETSAQQLELAKRDSPRDEAERFSRSAALLQEEQLEREKKISHLQVQLETLGGTGIGERLAQTVASIEQAERRHAELHLRANALSLLESVLVDERDQTVAALRAPLTNRIGHYLKRLFPTAEMSVDESLAPATLQRGLQSEELESLSYGTQEQLGILARLAYADLLKDAGRPTLLLFDDALVHTDDTRRDAVKRALLDAASRHQILIFTCHPSAWNDLGVKQRHLEDMRAASGVAM